MKAKDFLDFLKLPPNILAALSLVTGVILFAPESVIKQLYMVDFKKKYGFVISIVFLVSVAILTVLILTELQKKIKSYILNKKLRKVRLKLLLEADNVKTRMIKAFIKEPTHTRTIPHNDGLTIELAFYEVISLAGNTQPADFGLNNEICLRYFLQPWVISLINSDERLKNKYL